MARVTVKFYHCSWLLRDGALRIPCDISAVTVYVRPDGVRVGYCLRHRAEGRRESVIKGWQVAA